jgi:hypothetical protein
MQKFIRRHDGAPVEAMRLTDLVLDADHPSDLHIPGVEYSRLGRTARSLDDGSVACVGWWIVVDDANWISMVDPATFARDYVSARVSPRAGG